MNFDCILVTVHCTFSHEQHPWTRAVGPQKSESESSSCVGVGTSASRVVPSIILSASLKPFIANLFNILPLVLQREHRDCCDCELTQLFTHDSHPTTLWQQGETTGVLAVLLHITHWMWLTSYPYLIKQQEVYFYVYLLCSISGFRCGLLTWELKGKFDEEVPGDGFNPKAETW